MYKHIDAAATTVVSDQPCFLAKIIVGGGTTGAVTLYDAASGVDVNDKILIMNPEQGSEDALGSWDFELPLHKGLIVVTAAATELLVIYYRRDLDGGVPG